MSWKSVYRSVAGESLADAMRVAMAATGCCSRTARNWAEGRALLSAANWKVVVVYCQCEPRWRELAAARDAEAARKGKRGRKPVSPAEQLRRRSRKLLERAATLEGEGA